MVEVGSHDELMRAAARIHNFTGSRRLLTAKRRVAKRLKDGLARPEDRYGPAEPASLIRYAAFGGGLHAFDVLVKRPSRDFVGGCLPFGTAADKFRFGEGDVDAVLLGVDGDRFAVADQGDGAPSWLRA